MGKINVYYNIVIETRKRKNTKVKQMFS